MAATVTDFSGADVAVGAVGDGAGVAHVEVVTGDGILTVFFLEGVVEVVFSLEGAAPTATTTALVAGDVAARTVFVWLMVVTLADAEVGDGLQVWVSVADCVPAAETVVTCACVTT